MNNTGFAVASLGLCRLYPAIKIQSTILTGLLLIVPAARATEAAFAKTLTPEESQSAGLAKLTPAEFARLEALVERYRSGQVAVAQKAVAARPTEPAKAQKLLPDWVSAIITLQKAAGSPEKAQTLESSLVGDFSGWSGRSTFRLENGQLWAQANTDSYSYSPTLHKPKVQIYPASFGSYWLQIEGVNQRCRVKPVKLE